MQRSALCRSRRDLSNAYLLAKFGFDTAENEPSKVCRSGAGRCCRTFSADPIELYRACSQLYRSRILQENMRLKALAEIYTMHSFALLQNHSFFKGYTLQITILHPARVTRWLFKTRAKCSIGNFFHGDFEIAILSQFCTEINILSQKLTQNCSKNCDHIAKTFVSM